MGQVTDVEELLKLAKHDVVRQKILRALKTLAYMAAAFFGAGQAAQAYLDQLATKAYVDLLMKQEHAVHDGLDAKLAALADRQTRTETRVDDIRGTMRVKP